jgi:very-short-patch-repair endonuclease
MTDEHSQVVDLRVELDRRINFAMQQNDVPVVKVLRIENRTDTLLRDLEVRIATEPSFAQGWRQRLTAVGAHAFHDINAIDLQLSPGFLGELTERVRGRLCAEIWREGKVIGQHTTSVELLARDEWSGLASLPEILAAFVLPNHPAIEQLLRSAADFMATWTGDPSLNGYQSRDPKRTYSMAGAVYAALQHLSLTYVTPPASFEEEGQRVRLPDQILESRMATCLDVALLAAACLEQAGLNPLVILVRGHAFTGVWLRDECFPEPTVDDVLRLRKRVDLSELAVFDPTGVTTRPPFSFDRSVAEAKRRVYADDMFLSAVDVRRARKGRIRPLPARVARVEAHGEIEADGQESAPEPKAPDVSSVATGAEPEPREPEAEADTPATRLDRWRRKLLDLSLRNRLLNFRDTKKSLLLLCPNLGQLEDLLAAGSSFRILPRPYDFAEQDPRDAGAHQRRTGKEGLEELLREELKERRLHANTSSEELERRLIEIYREARLSLEEGGASALYLAIGFLAWYETDKSEERRRAPILLLPLELHRKSVREGFTLTLSDDEPRINVTLLEMLRQDQGLLIPGLDPLPLDESGLDVPQILRTVRQAVLDIDRWEVLDEVRIGLFSFTKFLMWRDLTQRTDDLMKNAVVEHLVNRPGQSFDPQGVFPRPELLDDERKPTNTFCPLPADSSQLAAVFAAADGRSFVLEGPPGTGKSQTITNLIAHCLTQEKTILFVSEKMAALNVVYRRLVKVGLGRYCLELHSNKAQKRQVIGQLDEALQRMEAHDLTEWERQARQLEELRNELNTYVQALHQKRSTGETVFQARSRLIGLRDTPRVDLRWSTPDALDAEAFAALRDLVERLATAGAACGQVPGNAWAAVRNAGWTPGWEEEVHSAIGSLYQATQGLAERTARMSEKLGLGESGHSLSDLDLIREATVAMMASQDPPTALLLGTDWDKIEKQLGTWIEHGRTRDRLRAEMRKRFRDDIITLDLDLLRTRLHLASESWWPASWWRRLPINKTLASVGIAATAPRKTELADVLNRAYAFRDVQRKINAASDEAQALLGRYWNNGEAVWDRIAELRDWARTVRAVALRAACHNCERAAALLEKWTRLLCESRDLPPRDRSVGREFVDYGEALDVFKKTRIKLAELLDLDVESIWGPDSTVDALVRMRLSVAGWQAAARQLRAWCAWRRARAKAMESNLAPLVEAYEQGVIDTTQLRPVFDRSFAQWWLGAVIDREPVLSQFFSPEHGRKIEQFRQVDDRFMELTRELIQARLAQRVPTASSSILPNSEIGILKREIGKRRAHMSIRQLLLRIPNLLPRLKPCLLMSPMSVAQYLDAGYPPFDVVVFDEASQIPVWDAVGAIARGRTAVIVGDPKQLPPTNFFQRADDDDESDTEDVVEDLESILDDCISSQIPWLPLDWHYRSRHESLIHFSNYHYYGNRLLTFPSPALEGLGVKWRHVPNGVYDKGKTRTNRGEAETVVADIMRRLRDPQLAQYSIGVVTFSQAQQTLIEDLLDSARREDPDLDAHFAEDKLEPVFIKNLENVQGDERDVILFSICYGPDSFGRISMNFGPMNREGGERRLNVAITRARREVIVYSTLRADQIDLTRTRARGAGDLKRFLEYAERGPSAIAQTNPPDPDAVFDSPFEEIVFHVLVQRGWQVHKQVGCARYRIDLAVVDPDAPGRYLLGIECDGANYHRAKTARDRDKLREGVLRELGWTLHRIWSTDWWTDPQREIRKLEDTLKQARESKVDTNRMAPNGTAEEASSVSKPTGGTFATGLASSGAGEATESATAMLEHYHPTAMPPPIGLPADFYDRRAVHQIIELLIEVVRQEGPISVSLATRRVAECWRFERVKSKAVGWVRQLIPTDHGIRGFSLAEGS